MFAAERTDILLFRIIPHDCRSGKEKMGSVEEVMHFRKQEMHLVYHIF